MAMAEGTGGGLIGKIDKIDFSPSDFFNETFVGDLVVVVGFKHHHNR